MPNGYSQELIPAGVEFAVTEEGNIMQAIEEALFDYEDIDVLGDASFQYYGCTMKIDIGPVKAGDEVSVIELNYDTSELKVYNEDDEVIVSAKISLAISDITVPS